MYAAFVFKVNLWILNESIQYLVSLLQLILICVDLLTVFHSSSLIQFNYFDEHTGRCYLLMLRRKITGKSLRRTNLWNGSNSTLSHVWPSQWKRAKMCIHRNWANQAIYLLNHWFNRCGMAFSIGQYPLEVFVFHGNENLIYYCQQFLICYQMLSC